MRRFNTLRNQILGAFAFVMLLVLAIVGTLTYSLVTDILKENARTQMQQTADQALGRVDSQFETINLITSQIATDPAVQQLLIQEQSMRSSSFAERQAMNEIINSYQAYTTGLTSFELYFTDERRLFPLNELPLSSRLDPFWPALARGENGRLVWAGRDPLDEQSFIVIKQINLIENSFQPGGYLITKVAETYFSLERPDTGTPEEETAVLLDSLGNVIAGELPEGADESLLETEQETVAVNGSEYVRAPASSDMTGWTLVIYSPVSGLLQGISGISAAIAAAGVVGLVIFLIVSWIVSTYLSKPIQQLTHAMRFGTLGALRKSQSTTSAREITELNETYNEMVETTNHLITAVYEKELVKTKAELKALQAQINPHFLFNTLEAVHWTLDERDEEMADMIISLSQLFRYTISDTEADDMVTVCEELEQVERYLHIMQLRFDERLHWEMTVEDGLSDCLLPKLMIQPLAENALLHGIGEQRGGGTVRIRAFASESPDWFHIEVADEGRGMTPDVLAKLRRSLHTSRSPNQTKGTGLAMRNLYQRLELAYPEAGADMTIDSESGIGTIVRLTLPLERRDTDENAENTDRG
ncbi:cache domain-containing sensor histidine kinase [Alkalicoccus urumqiensis]|uniref:Sensor histidine kinase n=1 Tax=Alkalicoccus urumqiensis TaxID=1548213 RepID=A0A2P6MIB6_ALKUR|nr:sensor histidine kinase [Alkalicoccus urumqiensis]PRO66035.1 sensor histidine kinase [Alkalicoccus urumqiensis]